VNVSGKNLHSKRDGGVDLAERAVDGWVDPRSAVAMGTGAPKKVKQKVSLRRGGEPPWRCPN